MEKGNLTEAERRLSNIDDVNARHNCALILIREYIGNNATAKAIHVYEDLTPEHHGRSEISSYSDGYESKACKMQREQLIKDGDYEKAWEYYLVSSSDDNYIKNAPDLFGYMSDVVAAMCAEGQQDDAIRFVESHLRWFVNNVDMSTDDYGEEIKANYSSELVRAKLQEQIDKSY